MIKMMFIVVFQLLSIHLFAQKIPQGSYKVKKNSSDTIILEKMKNDHSFDETILYMNKPCGFTDTTYYWSFYKQDSLKIETVIRKCYFSPNSNNKIAQKSEKAVLNLSSSEIRTSFWDEDKGVFLLKNNDFYIKNTKIYNGAYFYMLQRKGKIILIRKR
jgi:hypothetical protein